jgi:hypothetical protein
VKYLQTGGEEEMVEMSMREMATFKFTHGEIPSIKKK